MPLIIEIARATIPYVQPDRASSAGKAVVPGPPIWNQCPPYFTFGPPVAAYIQYCILKMWPPSVFLPLHLVFGRPCCYILATGLQPEMKFRSPPGQFHHKPPLIVASVTYVLLIARGFSSCSLPVTDSFCSKEMRIFSRIRTHQSTRETINTSLWRRKTKPLSFNAFDVVILVPNKICGAFPWRVSVFSVLWNIMFQK